MPYTVTIYVATPGTPFSDGGASGFGHVFYETSNGHTQNSWGFAPKKTEFDGPGEVSQKDAEHYVKPVYARTLEISEEQYNKLNQFGKDPVGTGGFSLHYNGAKNSCVDFTWSALNHAGLHSRIFGFVERENYEGSVKPMQNIKDIKTIEAPYRGSPLNREVINPTPDRSLLQWLVSEKEAETKLASNDSLQARHTLSATAENLKQKCDSNVRGFCEQHGQPWTHGMERTVVLSAAVAREAKMTDIEMFAVKDGNINLGQKDATGFGYITAQVNAREAANTPIEQALERLVAADQKMIEQENVKLQQTQTITQSGPKMV